jgi:hypothetical protein
MSPAEQEQIVESLAHLTPSFVGVPHTAHSTIVPNLGMPVTVQAVPPQPEPGALLQHQPTDKEASTEHYPQAVELESQDALDQLLECSKAPHDPAGDPQGIQWNACSHGQDLRQPFKQELKEGECRPPHRVCQCLVLGVHGLCSSPTRHVVCRRSS